MQVYEQLQEFLNKCLELWWKPRGYEKWFDFISMAIANKEWVYIDKHIYFLCIIWWDNKYYELSFHDLFSKDSGLMEFVEWKESEYLDYKRIDTPKDYWYDTDWQYHVMIMWPMTVDLKIDYFLENTLLPTKQD